MTTLKSLIGEELGPSRWIDVSQARINSFADATDDHQWIHVDEERAESGPFGTTIAHGYLTLSLVVPMLGEVLPRETEGGKMTVNYGVNRVRFPAPVPSGSKIRGRFRVASYEESPAGGRATIEATMECDATEKPVCVAEVIVLTVS
jgi:acyl dehydratase